MAILWIIIGAALVVLGALFAAQNPHNVDLTFFGAGLYGVPLWLLVAVPGLVGLLLGFLLSLPGQVRNALTGRRLSAQLRERDVTAGKLQQRVDELERDLAVARRPVTPLVVQEPPEIPTTETRTNVNAA